MENSVNRNYSTISPSAKSLLLMKGYTDIPLAREAAELIQHPAMYNPDFSNKDFTFQARVVHFESRYRSIDSLLQDISITNILELSSGYSMRGLDTVKRKEVHYIDTDLPDMTEAKKDLISGIGKGDADRKGILEILPLNALDENQFKNVVSHFPEGEIAIVNEGLLMYLDENEKKKLCGIIHGILKERGGCWITADIYLKHNWEKSGLNFDDNTKKFFEEHRIEENKFESFKQAEKFFRSMDFKIEKKAEIKQKELSSVKYFLKKRTLRQLLKIKVAGKLQASWRLRIAD